jgi:hypothetical protein
MPEYPPAASNTPAERKMFAFQKSVSDHSASGSLYLLQFIILSIQDSGITKMVLLTQ